MKTFMLGWEFPPHISGGLGTACYGLTKAMDRLGIRITFVLPKMNPGQHTRHVKMLSAQGGLRVHRSGEFRNTGFRTIASTLKPYAGSRTYERQVVHRPSRSKRPDPVISWHWGCSEHQENYGRDIYHQVQHYARKVAEIARIEEFDIVHAHDWMTYPAALAVARLKSRPLVVHVHSTEFDRSGEHANRMICEIERQGMDAATTVIAVSNLTKNIIVSRYGIAPEKVEVVYNGVESNNRQSPPPLPEKSDKVVLFLGRITMQKGPEYFLAAAKKVLERMEHVKFVMAGEGDMLHRSIDLAVQMGIGHKVLFTRFLRGSEVDRMYQMADLYVMPSVSEPFGITPLEALQHGVPVVISRQSGVAEVLKHALKVDFWDINQMANKILAVLRYPTLRTVLCENARTEASRFRWEDSAARVKEIYEQAIAL